MFETKKTLIVVYKDELLMNQLRKLVESHDDTDDDVVGTRDGSINIVSWTEKVWLGNKKAGNIKGKILFLDEIKGMDKLIPVIDVIFDECGIKYGWAGNQAVLYVDTKSLLKRADYDEFLNKLSELPVPSFLKTAKDDIKATGITTELLTRTEENESTEVQRKKGGLFKVAKGAIEAGTEAVGKVGNRIAATTEELFRNKSLMKRQMLFYGVVKLYNDGLESFMNM